MEKLINMKTKLQGREIKDFSPVYRVIPINLIKSYYTYQIQLQDYIEEIRKTEDLNEL